MANRKVANLQSDVTLARFERKVLVNHSKYHAFTCKRYHKAARAAAKHDVWAAAEIHEAELEREQREAEYREAKFFLCEEKFQRWSQWDQYLRNMEKKTQIIQRIAASFGQKR